MARVSLIVPSYNAEKYIDKCLNSIEKQTFKDMDVTLVDDGSNDKTLEKMLNYQEKSKKNVKIITQSNKGQAFARKVGLDSTDSDYVTFLDSDDYINNTYIEELVKSLEDNVANISIARGGIHLNVPLLRKILIKGKCGRAGVIDLKHEKDILPTISVVTNMKLYRRQFVELTSSSYRANEDMCTTYLMLAKARYVSYANDAIYHYLPNSNGSVANYLSGFEYEKIINALMPLEEMRDKFIECDLFDLYYHQIEARFINQIFQRINIINVKNINIYDKKKLISILLQFLNLHFPNWQENNDYLNNFINYELSDTFLTIFTKILLKYYTPDDTIKNTEDIYNSYKEVSNKILIHKR